MISIAKRQIFLTLGIILGLSNLNAQKSGDLELGTNTGLSFASVSVPGENTTGTRVTFNVGASGEYYFSDRWGLKMKIIYDNKGYTNGTIIDKNLYRYTTDILLNYITIPIMANWHFSKHRRWYLSFGPYWGLLTSATDSKFQSDIKDQVNSFDYGIAYSIGYKFKIDENAKLYLEHDGQLGIKNIFAGDNDYSVWNMRGAYNVGVLIDL